MPKLFKSAEISMSALTILFVGGIAHAQSNLQTTNSASFYSSNYFQRLYLPGYNFVPSAQAPSTPIFTLAPMPTISLVNTGIQSSAPAFSVPAFRPQVKPSLQFTTPAPGAVANAPSAPSYFSPAVSFSQSQVPASSATVVDSARASDETHGSPLPANDPVPLVDTCYGSSNLACGQGVISPQYLQTRTTLPANEQKKDDQVVQNSYLSGNWNSFSNMQSNRVDQNLLNTSANTCLTNLTTIAGGPAASACAVTTPLTGTAATTPVLTPGADRKLNPDDSCPSAQLPSNGGFGGNYIKGVTADPDNPKILYGISEHIEGGEHAMYISRSEDGGKTWSAVSKINPTNSKKEDVMTSTESASNSLVVNKGSPKSFVFTTKAGGFRAFPSV